MTAITRPAIRYLPQPKTFMARLAADYKNWDRGLRGFGDTDASGAFVNLPAYNPAADTTNPFTPLLTTLSSESGTGTGGGGGANLTSMTPLLLLGGLLLVVLVARK